LQIVPHFGYYLVKDQTGKTVAQGSLELCERIAAGEPRTITLPGDLFEEAYHGMGNVG
jgi:hypothetical protein